MRPVDDTSTSSPNLTGKPLEIKAHQEGDSITIALSGEMDLSMVDSLETAIWRAEQTEAERIVLDLSDLSFLDSTGLSVLLRASQRSSENGNRLSFIPSKHEVVTGLVALTGTGTMFD